MSDRRIPSEYLGKARLFRNKIIAADQEFVAMHKRVFDELERRIERKPSFRESTCIDLLRDWRACRPFGYLPDLTADLDFSKHQITIRDLRLIASMERNAEWKEGYLEDSIALTEFRLVGNSKKTPEGALCSLKWHLNTITTFSLHALARYYQRAIRPSDDALISSMYATALAPLSIIRKDRGEMFMPFAIPFEAAGGHWFGEVKMMAPMDKEQDQPIDPTLCVRTFHEGPPGPPDDATITLLSRRRSDKCIGLSE